MTDLAILYEHPAWFERTFAALDARGIDYVASRPGEQSFDPADRAIPARVVFNRIAMSSFLRADEHPIYYTQALLAHWAANGARVINGAATMAIDASKARQLSLIAALGLSAPASRIVHRAGDLVAASDGLRFPVVVKADVGGSGAGIVRYDDVAALAAGVAERSVPRSINGVLIVQEYVPVRRGRITRIETLAGRFLYAIDVDGGGGFDLCPADVCLATPGKPVVTLTEAKPDAALIDAAERIAAAAGLDVGGIEVMIDDRDGTPLFYDINALSNFVANPLDVLGWDPHERLVDWLERVIAGARV